jgi:hypothetical protein
MLFLSHRSIWKMIISLTVQSPARPKSNVVEPSKPVSLALDLPNTMVLSRCLLSYLGTISRDQPVIYFTDKYLAELSCPSSLVIPPLYASGYDDGIYGSLQQQRSPYGPVLPSPSVPYGRPANYSNQQVIYHGPQVQLSAPSNYAGPAPYNGGLPQQPVYGLRYN